MKEYIEREAARDMMEQALVDEWEIQYADDRLDEIPAADVVEKKRNFIDGANLACKIAGHSYYHGDAILSKIGVMMEGKDTENSVRPANVVAVVRCRDCDIGTCYSDDSVQCEWSNGFYADDYCPRGKRKGGNE